MRSCRVLFVVYPGCQLLDFAGPFEVFAGANTALGRSAYRLVVAALDPGSITTDSGVSITATATIDSTAPRRGDTVIVVGGRGADTVAAEPRLRRFLAGLPAGVRCASICNGAFVLAAAGLLDGRRATTHWRKIDEFARSYPRIVVQPDAIYVNDGNVWTSAGVTAGIDLAVAMVEQDHDSALAQEIARSLVMFLRRPGGQSQFSTPVWSVAAKRTAIQVVQDAVHSNPERDWTIAAMASEGAMSQRNFVRVFAAEVGITPARYVERVRVEAARTRLESTDHSIDTISRTVGFGTPDTMRRAFQRQLATTPQEHRRHFQARSETTDARPTVPPQVEP